MDLAGLISLFSSPHSDAKFCTHVVKILPQSPLNLHSLENSENRIPGSLFAGFSFSEEKNLISRKTVNCLGKVFKGPGGYLDGGGKQPLPRN